MARETGGTRSTYYLVPPAMGRPASSPDLQPRPPTLTLTRPAFVARRLHEAMKGWGTEEGVLIRLLAGIDGGDMAECVRQHGQSARLGSAPARPLCLLSARLAAPGGLALPG